MGRCLSFILLSQLTPSLFHPSQALTSLPPFSSASLAQLNSETRTPQLPFRTASSPQTLQPPNPLDTSELFVQTDFAAGLSRTVEVISPTVSLVTSTPSGPTPVSMATRMSWTTPPPSFTVTHPPSTLFLSTNSARASSPRLTPTPPPITSSTPTSFTPSQSLVPTTSAYDSLPSTFSPTTPTTDVNNGGTVRSTSALPLGATVAVAAVGVVLLVAVLIALLVCCWCCCRHRRKYEYSTGEYRVTVQTWNATNPVHYTVSKSESCSRSSIRSSFGLKPKVLSNKNQTNSDNVLGVYSTPL